MSPSPATPVTDPLLDGLVRGCPPAWASAWGEDDHGIFIDFCVGAARQRLRWVPGGCFRMGSPRDEPGRYNDEGPDHWVTLPGFWLFDTPCTQALWVAVMGENPSQFQDPRRPVENVSRDDAQGFIEGINGQVLGLGLCLPSEAQWEHACRAGTETALYSGPIEIRGDADAPALDPIAWYGGNSNVDFELDNGLTRGWLKQPQYPGGTAGTHPVGLKQPNAWGLYDMLGNVWEWTADHWHASYQGAPTDGSAWLDAGAEGGAQRMVRGGAWADFARGCRCAYRSHGRPGIRCDGQGFRCARVQG